MPVWGESFMKDSAGKTIQKCEWDEDGYWVFTFTDGSELCFKSMAELEVA